MGSYAELKSGEVLAAQALLAGFTDTDPQGRLVPNLAAVARAVNIRFSSPSRPQVVSRQFLSRLRHGKTRRCTPELAEQIALVLGATVEALFDMHGVRKDVGRNAA